MLMQAHHSESFRYTVEGFSANVFNLSYVEADDDTGEEVTEYFCAHWQVLLLLLHLGAC